MMVQQVPAGFAGIDLLGAWQRLREQQPNLRIRDGAGQLNVSEAELVYASIGRGVQRLQADWQALLHGLPALGRVMALTRNEHCVHERHGVYGNISVGGSGRIALVANGEIDLRLFLRQWASLFAVTEELSNGGMRRSLQAFDRQGRAVHKIYLTEASNASAWYDLCEQLHNDNMEPLTIAPTEPATTAQPDRLVDGTALREEWAQLKDTHHFMALLNRHSVSRVQALRLAGREWAEQLPVTSLAQTLEHCAASGQHIMVFVSNHACIQIHTGAVHQVRRLGDWFNVLDPAFSLHLREAAVSQLWRVRKPTTDGIVTALEAYDATGELIVQVFGERKPGQPEQRVWRDVAESHAVL